MPRWPPARSELTALTKPGQQPPVQTNLRAQPSDERSVAVDGDDEQEGAHSPRQVEAQGKHQRRDDDESAADTEEPREQTDDAGGENDCDRSASIDPSTGRRKSGAAMTFTRGL